MEPEGIQNKISKPSHRLTAFFMLDTKEFICLNFSLLA